MLLKRISFALLLFCLPLSAQTTGSDSAAIEALQAAVKASQSAGDNAWMLVSAALVLMMTGPGLALFYCGLVRKKSVLGTMMQSFAMMAIITLVWAVCGYSLVFSRGNPIIGGLEYLFLNGVGGAPNPLYAATIPHQTFMIYQLMFAVITPALIAGAFAERMRFSAMVIFSTLWAFLVYFPVAHMVWGDGGLLSAALGGRYPGLRFRRRHGGAHHVGFLSPGHGPLPRQARGLSGGQDGAAQSGAQLHGRLFAVGRLVRLQCR